jgi:hypothetical protein
MSTQTMGGIRNTLFYFLFLNWHSKVECLSLVSLSSLVLYNTPAYGAYS